MGIIPGIEPLVRLLPSRMAAFVDYYLRPHLRDQWGGPFNGQRQRQQIFLDLLSVCRFEAIVETGTFRGSTTEFLAHQSNLPVFSVESSPRYYHYAARRLCHSPDVSLALGDSVAILDRLKLDPAVPKTNVFFYLDAHWYAHLPLLEEIRIIAAHWSDPVIMIDDFQVPGDDGYAYDDYGSGQRLCLEYLAPLAHLRLSPFFPSASSQTETSKKRGCVVLAGQTSAARLASLRSLRPHSDSATDSH